MDRWQLAEDVMARCLGSFADQTHQKWASLPFFFYKDPGV